MYLFCKYYLLYRGEDSFNNTVFCPPRWLSWNLENFQTERDIEKDVKFSKRNEIYWNFVSYINILEWGKKRVARGKVIWYQIIYLLFLFLIKYCPQLPWRLLANDMIVKRTMLVVCCTLSLLTGGCKMCLFICILKFQNTF